MARKDKPEKILKIHMKPAPRLGEDEDKVPTCPAFRQIGETFGGVDVALIPIGCVSGLSSPPFKADCSTVPMNQDNSCPACTLPRRIAR